MLFKLRAPASTFRKSSSQFTNTPFGLPQGDCSPFPAQLIARNLRFTELQGWGHTGRMCVQKCPWEFRSLGWQFPCSHLFPGTYSNMQIGDACVPFLELCPTNVNLHLEVCSFPIRIFPGTNKETGIRNQLWKAGISDKGQRQYRKTAHMCISSYNYPLSLHLILTHGCHLKPQFEPVDFEELFSCFPASLKYFEATSFKSPGNIVANPQKVLNILLQNYSIIKCRIPRALCSFEDVTKRNKNLQKGTRFRFVKVAPPSWWVWIIKSTTNFITFPWFDQFTAITNCPVNSHREYNQYLVSKILGCSNLI